MRASPAAEHDHQSRHPGVLNRPVQLAGGANAGRYPSLGSDVNRSGGMNVGGRNAPVEIVWRDDGSRRDNVRAITERLIAQDRVDLLIGPYSAVLTNAAAGVAQSRASCCGTRAERRRWFTNGATRGSSAY